MSKGQSSQFVLAGDQFAEMKEWDKAIESYERALEESPNDKLIHERIIRSYIGKHDRKGYLAAVNRWNEIKASPKKAQAPGKAKAPASPGIKSLDDLGIPAAPQPPKPEAQKPPKPPAPREQPPAPRHPAPTNEPPAPKHEPPAAREMPGETPKLFTPPELLRKEPPSPKPSPALREIPFPSKPQKEEPPKPAPPAPQQQARQAPPATPPPKTVPPAAPQQTAKPAPQRPAQPPQPAEPETPAPPVERKAPPPAPAPEKAFAEEKRIPVTDADIAEADARQLEKQGKKEASSKIQLQAAKLWEDKGDKEKAGMAYEKAYELAPSKETLSKLNELYGQGVKLKQSTVMEIYRRIYNMKV